MNAHVTWVPFVVVAPTAAVTDSLGQYLAAHPEDRIYFQVN